MRRDRSILYIGPLPGRHEAGGAGIINGRLLAALAHQGTRVRAVTGPLSEPGTTDRFAATHPEFAVIRYSLSANDGPAGSVQRLLAHQQGILSRLPALLAAERPGLLLLGRPAVGLWLREHLEARALPVIVCLPSPLQFAVDGVDRYPQEISRAMLELLQSADAVVAVADHIATDLAAVGVARVVKIPNSVDTSRFAPQTNTDELRQQHQIPRDAIVVLHASNLKPVKRVGDLIDAALKALEANPKLFLLIIGGSPQRASLARRRADLGIGARVRFLPWVEHSMMPGIINTADLVVMPSASEGMSLSYLEAQACGKTLLASDIPAARECIEDGQTGVLSPLGDVATLSGKILQLAASPVLRQRIGRQARRAAAARHSFDGMVAAYAELLSQVIDDHGRSN